MMAHPPGWCSALLGELITLNPKTNVADSTIVGFVPMQDLGTSMGASLKFEPRQWLDVKKAYTHFADGDVLLAKITPCFENGKAGIARGLPNGLGAGSSEFFVCRPRAEAVEARYLLAWFSTRDFRARAETQMTGSVGHKRVPKDFVLGETLPLAPRNEQQRIADKLDAVLSRADACRERLDRVAPLLKRFRQSVLSAATSGRLTEDLRSVGQFPAWCSTTVERVCLSVADGDHQAPPQAASGVPFITISAINDGRLSLQKASRYVPRPYFEGLADKRRPRRGDVLYSVTASLGIPAVVDIDAAFAFQRHIAILRPNPEVVSSEFLYYLLSSEDVRRQAYAAATGTAQLTLALSSLREIALELPAPSEQAEIVSRIEALFAFADRLEARLGQAQTAVDRLTPSILAKAFRGELVPQDPADEPAPALLARVRESQQEPAAAIAVKRLRGRPRKAA